MLELLIALLIVTILTTITLSNQYEFKEDYYTFHDAYLQTKAKAMLEGKTTPFEKDIYFNDKGNVNKAQTIYFNQNAYTIQLGPGVIIQQE